MIINGDCLEEMRKMEDNSISAIVTDPPYGLHFMGKDWDKFNKSNFDEKCDHKIVKRTGEKNPERLRGIRSIYSANAVSGTYDETRNDEFESFIEQFGIEALRIVKPGGHILMFGAPRRYHRQVSGLEDAGWKIRDCLVWIFGSGFPKSHNHFGIEGYGTALKPAYEPIIMAMKPCEGTFKQNAEKWGQAGINIDGSRIASDDDLIRECLGHAGALHEGYKRPYHELAEKKIYGSTKGRWPANVIFDEESSKQLDSMTGFEASRFFYCAKASSSERNEGLESFIDKKMTYMATSNGTGNPSITTDDQGKERDRFSSIKKNNHPTVKPLKLMQYLIKLVMPPKDGVLLDPFAGSGTTILAAHQLGLKAIGIEKSAEYCEIARARIENYKPDDNKELDLFDIDKSKEAING
jgi:DNA modification methylase